MADIPQKRRYFRLPTAIQVNVFDTSGIRYSLNMRDLSAGGMNLTAEGGFPVNSYLKLQKNRRKGYKKGVLRNYRCQIGNLI